MLFRIIDFLEEIIKGESSSEGWGHISMIIPIFNDNEDWIPDVDSHATGIHINQQSDTRHQDSSQTRTMKHCAAAFSNNKNSTVEQGLKRLNKKADLYLNVTVGLLLQINWFGILLIFIRNVRNSM